nr:MAG TPA: hypothetical protein [Caudoviricetes sp.]
MGYRNQFRCTAYRCWLASSMNNLCLATWLGNIEDKCGYLGY